MSAHRRAGRRAPTHFIARAPFADPSWHDMWRGLSQAYVPDAGGTSASVGSRRLIELLHGVPTIQGSTDFGTVGQATGLGLLVSNNPSTGILATNSAKWGPAVGAAFSVFCYGTRIDSTAALQALIGNGFSGFGGWTLQLNYGAGQLGMTRWGVGDDASTTLGTVPNNGTPSGLGVAYAAGGPARFFLNGQFQQVASGNMTGAGIGDFVIGRTSSGGLRGFTIQVLYLWNRVLSDGEFRRLYADPYGPIRPRRTAALMAGGSATVTPGTGALTLTGYAPGVSGAQLRVTQVGLKVLVSDAVSTAAIRATQAGVKALVVDTPDLRVTQAGVKALLQDTADLRVTQAGVKALAVDDPDLRVTQVGVKVLVAPSALSVPLTGLLFPRGSVPPF